MLGFTIFVAALLLSAMACIAIRRFVPEFTLSYLCDLSIFYVVFDVVAFCLNIVLSGADL